MISRHAFSLCFIGQLRKCQNGFVTDTDEDAQVKRAVLAQPGKSICLADHSIFGRLALVGAIPEL